MNFDVELKVMESDEQELRKRLQKYVDGEWNRLKSLADARNVPVQSLTLPSWHNRTNGVPRPADDPTTPRALTIDDVKLGLDPNRPEAPPGDEPPQIELSYPEWTKGTFTVLAPTSANLVTHAVAEGPLSLTGPEHGLRHHGADRGRRDLHAEDSARGDGRRRVRHAAGRRAHDPVLHVATSAGAAQDRGRQPRGLQGARVRSTTTTTTTAATTDDIAHYETQLEMAVQAKLINVQLDTGMLELESDLVSELRSTAMEVVTDMMEESFFEETEPPADEADLTTAETRLLHPQAAREGQLRVVLLQGDDQLGHGNREEPARHAAVVLRRRLRRRT